MGKEYTDIEQIAAQLIEAKEAYYNTGNPVMSDAEFDALEDELRRRDPGHHYFSLVGTDVAAGKKVEHKVPLLSMAKAKTIQDVQKWLKRLALEPGTGYVIEPKIDGLSATCKYSKGQLQYVATRGDGSVGQDISHIAEYVQDIKDRATFTDQNIEVRGELYLPKNTELATEGRPLRNICVGLINRKEDREDLAYVRFAVYQVVAEKGFRFETDKIETLKTSGFNTAACREVTTLDEIESYYAAYLEQLRDEWEYETDGLTIMVNDSDLHAEIDSRWVVDHHHHYAIALKAPAEAKKTRLTAIDWQISRQGSVIPVALFEPVHIGGAKLERASLSNVDNVINLRLAIGDELLIERANDVIPYVKENLSAAGKGDEYTPGAELIPASCPSCETGLEKQGVHLKCVNPDCSEKRIQQILFWVKKSGIENVAEATIRTLYGKGKVGHIKDLYLLTKDDFAGIEGFAEKKIENFISELNGAKSMTARELISKLGIPLVQQRALAKISIYSIDDFLRFNDITYIVGRNIITWKEDPANMNLLNELLEILDVKDEQVVEKKGKVCMTGSGPRPRNELIREIEDKGYEFVNTVTKDLDILICEDTNGKSSKLAKARKNGTTLMSYEEFFE